MTYIPSQELDRAAFGETITADLHPFFQLAFPYSTNSISPEYIRSGVTGSGTVTCADSKLIVSTGTTPGSTAYAETRKFAPYHPGQGIRFRAAGFFVNPATGTSPEIGIGDEEDGFFFCYDPANGAFSINRRRDGSDNIINQSAWNLDRADGNYVLPAITDWNLGIPFQIKYQFLGYGAIVWYVENPVTGEYVPVHIERYANTANVPSVNNPSFPGRIYVANGGTSNDVKVCISSIAAFNEGDLIETGPIFSAKGSNNVTGEESIISIRNPATVDGIKNRKLIKVKKVYVSSDGTKPVNIGVYRNATLSGSTTFSSINPSSIAEVDISNAVTVSSGIPIDSPILQKNTSDKIKYDSQDYIIYPGEMWTFTGASAASNDVGVSVQWQEN